MAFMSGIVFVHRKGMDFKVRHGLCTEKGHDLLIQAWSLCMERAWLTKSGIISSNHLIFHSYLFVHCLGSHSPRWVLVRHCLCLSLNYSLITLRSTHERRNLHRPFSQFFKTIFRFLLLFIVMDHLVL